MKKPLFLFLLFSMKDLLAEGLVSVPLIYIKSLLPSLSTTQISLIMYGMGIEVIRVARI